METVKSNILIAEFMGSIERSGHFFYDSDPTFGKPMAYKPDALCYHRSWDWIIPVVIKMQEIMHDTFKIVDIETTYNSMVEFIKWYNQNK